MSRTKRKHQSINQSAKLAKLAMCKEIKRNIANGEYVLLIFACCRNNISLNGMTLISTTELEDLENYHSDKQVPIPELGNSFSVQVLLQDWSVRETNPEIILWFHKHIASEKWGYDLLQSIRSVANLL